jgi:type I restriction enzyme M protein
MAAAKRERPTRRAVTGANLGFEEKLWAVADKMRGHMDPAEDKHVTLGLIFLKYISDAFDERHLQLDRLTRDEQSEYYVGEGQARYEVLEDRDEYLAENIFWVPLDARWSMLQANARQPTIGKLIDDAMTAIEKRIHRCAACCPRITRVRPSTSSAWAN